MERTSSISCGLDLSSGDRIVSGEPLSEASRAALATARKIARADGAKLHLLTALDLDASALWLTLREQSAGNRTVLEAARDRLQELADEARKEGTETTTEASASAPADALLQDAEREGRDLIVVGTRERGAVARNLLGSTSLTLVRRARCPVWIARTVPGEHGRSVLATIDLGDMAPRIVGAAAAAVARRPGSTLHVLHVVDLKAEDVLRAGAADESIIREYREHRRERAAKEIPEIVAAAVGPGARIAPTIHLPDGDPNDVIVETAERIGADLVVLGSVVHSALDAALGGLGRTAESVLPRLHASLLVLKPRPPAP